VGKGHPGCVLKRFWGGGREYFNAIAIPSNRKNYWIHPRTPGDMMGSSEVCSFEISKFPPLCACPLKFRLLQITPNGPPDSFSSILLLMLPYSQLFSFLQSLLSVQGGFSSSDRKFSIFKTLPNASQIHLQESHTHKALSTSLHVPRTLLGV
jgi:hypothetical protein